MAEVRQRFEFASDNTAGICPEAWAELEAANRSEVSSYGEDPWTKRLCQAVRDLFETDCEVFLVFNGTAANALALAQICRSFQSVICHEYSHIESDECGAVEFFSGGAKLIPTPGENGKLDLTAVKAALARQRELHSPKPRALSVTQATELGAIYSVAEVEAIAAFARERNLLLHMDGARFANAVAAANCQPKQMTWQAGVDVLCFGGTKNGTAAGELVVFFNKDLAREFEYRAKQAGQLASKMRFLAAPWLALLRDDIWLKNARHANRAAQLLAQKLREAAGLEVAFPCEASAVFLRLQESLVRALHERGWHFYKFVEPDIYRLMCSWTVSDESVAAFVGDVVQLQSV